MDAFTLSTDKIRLRALEPEDVALLYQWENDPDIWLISNTIAPYSKYMLSEYVNASIKDIYEAKQLRLMIVDQKNNQTVGILDIFDFDPYHLRAGIGILIEKRYRRQGFAEETIMLAIQYLFNHLHLHQIFCNVMEHNTYSIALFHKSGFVKVGCKKDWIRTTSGFEGEITMQLINTNNSQ